MPKDVLLIAIGSSGDVHPFVGLGLALLRKGHRVTVATGDYFKPLVQRAGLGFESLGTVEEYHNAIQNPDIWHPVRGFKTVIEFSLREGIPRVYELIERLYQPGKTVVAGTLLAIGARIAQEKLGVPYASVGFAPTIIRSKIVVSKLAGFPVSDSSPMWYKSFMFWLADTLVIDRLCAPYVNGFRARLGLKPVRSIMKKWWYSPQLNICMWPEVFGRIEKDWPINSVLTGFPLYDEAGATPLPSELSEFLDAGTPPICFTPGSAMVFGQDFFVAAAEACRRIGRRGVFLTRYPEQIPKTLPPGVVHCAYAPFTQLLPRAAALVHHGGIGTTSQAYAAGVPQLLMPMAHDQFDNADRITRLNIGDWLSRKDFTADRVEKKLLHLLTAPGVATACQRIAKLNAMLPNGCDAAAEAAAKL